MFGNRNRNVVAALLIAFLWGAFAMWQVAPEWIPAWEKAGKYNAWCDTNYHPEVGCILHDEIARPQSRVTDWRILSWSAQRGLLYNNGPGDDREWCKRIYHRNISCRWYGEVTIPQEFLEAEELKRQEWCYGNDYEGEGCERPEASSLLIEPYLLDGDWDIYQSWIEGSGLEIVGSSGTSRGHDLLLGH